MSNSRHYTKRWRLYKQEGSYSGGEWGIASPVTKRWAKRAISKLNRLTAKAHIVSELEMMWQDQIAGFKELLALDYDYPDYYDSIWLETLAARQEREEAQQAYEDAMLDDYDYSPSYDSVYDYLDAL